jgi:hypothetical protein
MLGMWDRLNRPEVPSEDRQAEGNPTRYRVGKETERDTAQLSGPDVCRILHAAAKRTCWDVPRYRKSGPLKEPELSLGFLAFTLWYLDSLKAHANGDDSPLNYPSDPARFEATRVIAYAADQGAVKAELRRTFCFTPITELKWAAQKANNSGWTECLTRAVIMGCRSMAYSVATAAGYNSMAVDITDDGLALGIAIEKVPPNAVIAAASVWLNQAFGENLSRQLLSLDKIKDGAEGPLPYLTRPMPSGEKGVIALRTREEIAKTNPTTYQYYGSAENEADLICGMEQLASLAPDSPGLEQMQDTSIWGSEEMKYFNRLKKDAGSLNGTLIELETELKQRKGTQAKYNASRHTSLRLAEETFNEMDVFLEQQAQRYVVAHPEDFFTKDKIADIRTHPEEYPEFAGTKTEGELGKWIY